MSEGESITIMCPTAVRLECHNCGEALICSHVWPEQIEEFMMCPFCNSSGKVIEKNLVPSVFESVVSYKYPKESDEDEIPDKPASDTRKKRGKTY